MAEESPPAVEQFRFSHPIEVRFRDLDGMGHVNNAVYATYFETARIRYMSELARRAATPAANPREQSFILLDLYCRYVDQVSYGERLLVRVRTSEVGTKSFRLSYLITAEGDGRTVAWGSTTQVGFDYASGRTVSLPEAFRRAVTDLEG